MAPAVQYHQAKMHTITTVCTRRASQTESVTESAVADLLANNHHVSDRETSTSFHTSYTPVVSTPKTPHSERESHHLQIHGVVSGERMSINVETDLSANPGSPRLSAMMTTMTGKEWQTEQLQIVPQPTKEPTTIATSTSHPPRKTPSSSSYPRPSPPGILYPTPIVPLSVLSSQFAAAVANAITIPYPTPTPMSHSNITPAHLPTNYKFLLVAILTVVVLSAAWSLLVCCMSVPADWWKRGWGGAKKQKKKERRPVDKVSKYGGVKKEKKQQGGQGDGAAEGMEMELQHRPRHRRQRDTTCDGEQACSASTYGSNGTGTVRRRVISSAPATSFPLTATATTTAAQTPSSTLSSPMNPFLDPPIPNPLDQHHEQRVRRTSVEWERERAAFFLSANAMTADAFAGTCASASTSRFMSVPLTPRRSYSRSRSRSPSPSPLHRTDTEALEAMEAGTAPPSPPPPSAGSTADEKSGVLSKSMSLIGEGLLMMDGAVDGFVARMGRWTDDEGGEEALLLLPLSQPKRGGVDA